MNVCACNGTQFDLHRPYKLYINRRECQCIREMKVANETRRNAKKTWYPPEQIRHNVTQPSTKENMRKHFQNGELYACSRAWLDIYVLEMAQ